MLDIIKTFPSPKNALHNYYQMFYNEQNKTVRLTPSYKTIKDGKNSKWMCTYHIFWPEEVKFVAKDTSKKEASLKAAAIALSWLKNQGKMTAEGAPIIYDNEEVKKLTRKTIPTFSLSPKILNNINKLTELYENELLPTISADKEEHKDSGLDLSETIYDAEGINIGNNRTKKFLGLDKYIAKEEMELPITKYK